MEVSNFLIKGSISTMHFLNYFSCLHCREIGTLPCFLKCNHIYCENCVLYYNMKQNDGNYICPFCLEVTKKEDFLPESEMRLLLLDLKSIDDEQFCNKYKNKLNFYRGDCDFRDIVLFLLKFFSIENKLISNNGNTHKKCFKRVHLELKSDKCADINDNHRRIKPVFKAN